MAFVGKAIAGDLEGSQPLDPVLCTLTVVYAIPTGQESFTVLKALFLTLIIGGVIGLKAAHKHHPRSRPGWLEWGVQGSW